MWTCPTPNTAVNDLKLTWPYEFHYKVASGEKVSSDEILDVLNDLKKQNEYAMRLSCEVRTLKAEVERLRAENEFLTNQINGESDD